MAKYNTQAKWDGSWHDSAPLTLSIANAETIVPADGAPATGTVVTWSGPNGSGSITFYKDGQTFNGNMQRPGKGPVGYKGTIASS